MLIFRFLLSLSLVLLALPIHQAWADSRQRVAVIDFESKVEKKPKLGEAVAENLRTKLIQSGAFRVLERAQIDKAIKEIGFAATGFVDQSQAAKAGRILGADVVIIGSVVRLGDSLTVNSRFIDVAQGEAHYAESVEGEYESDLSTMVNILVKRIAKAYPLQGSVIDVESNDRFYVDLGSEHGVGIGDIFTVFRRGATLRDTSGHVLGTKEETLGPARIVSVETQHALAEFVGKDKAVTIRKGDSLKAGTFKRSAIKAPVQEESPPVKSGGQQEIPISF